MVRYREELELFKFVGAPFSSTLNYIKSKIALNLLYISRAISCFLSQLFLVFVIDSRCIYVIIFKFKNIVKTTLSSMAFDCDNSTIILFVLLIYSNLWCIYFVKT